MHPHYGVGTSTEPIVISDDEDEAAFVEFTLEQRISSPTDSVDYDAYHNAGWQQEQPVYVEDDSIPENATGTSLYPPEDEVGQKRKRANSVNSAEGQSALTKPSRRAVSPNAPPGESRQGRKKRRKRERQAAEAAKMNGSTSLPLPSSSQPYQPPQNQQVKPKFPLPPKPVPVLVPPPPLFVPQPLPPSTYLHSPISPSLPKPPVHPYDLGWAQYPPRPPVEPLPTIPAPHPVSRVGLPPPDNLQLPKKTIGMPPDSDPHSQHGVYILPSHYQWKPNPARSLVIELLPKRFRTLGFVLEWAGTVCPPGTPPRVELDARIGKALIEFPSADIARTAWESPRLYGGGQEHIRAYWYRLPGIGVDAGVGELEEGEIEDGELVNGASVKVNGQKRRKNRAASTTTSVASTSTFSNAFSVPFSPSSLPSASSTTSVTFADGKWRSKSIVQAEEPPTTPSLPPGARWVYQDGRWVIQYLRSSLEPDHLPPPISLSAFVDPQAALAETDLNRMNEEGALDPDSDEALLKLTRGEPVVFTDGRRFPAQARNNNSLDHNHLPPPVAEPFYPTTQPGPSLMQPDRAPSFDREEAKRPRNGKQAVPLNRNRSLVSEESMEIASEDGGVYPSITSIGSSFAIGPPEAYPELSPRAYIAALTGSNERPHHMRANNNGQEKSADSNGDMTGALGLLYPDEPSPRMPVHAPLPRLPAKSASHVVSGSTLIRSSTPSPSPSATAPYSNKPLPVDVTLNASNTRSASASTSTPLTGQDRAQDLKQTLLARQKELEEAITKTKDAMAAKMAAPRSGTATPTASEVPVESFEEIPGLTASSTSTLTPATKALKLEPDTSAKARNTAKEDELRRLVLNSKRSRVVGQTSRPPQPSSSAGSSTTQDVKPVAVVSETTTTTITTTKVTTTKSEVDLDSLAASFIAETIQTVSGPSRADKSASPPPPVSAAGSGPDIVLPPPSVSASTALDSLAPVISGFQAMSEIERLVYKEKLLGRKIAESKMYMEQYTNAPTKALKKDIRQKMDECMRMYDEQMKSLETSKPQSKNSMNTNTRVQLHNSAASNSRGPTPGFTNGYAHSHMYGNGGRQSPWWPETNEAMIIDISDEESGEEEG